MPANDDALRAAFEKLAESSKGRLAFRVITTRELGSELGVNLARSPNPVYDFALKEDGTPVPFTAYTLSVDGTGRVATRAEALAKALAAEDGRLFERNPFL